MFSKSKFTYISIKILYIRLLSKLNSTLTVSCRVKISYLSTILLRIIKKFTIRKPIIKGQYQ